MKIIWFVNSGPDASHLWDVAPFNTLREARQFAESLPLTPIGHKRPYRIERAEYSASHIYGDSVEIRTVEV